LREVIADSNKMETRQYLTRFNPPAERSRTYVVLSRLAALLPYQLTRRRPAALRPILSNGLPLSVINNVLQENTTCQVILWLPLRPSHKVVQKCPYLPACRLDGKPPWAVN